MSHHDEDLLRELLEPRESGFIETSQDFEHWAARLGSAFPFSLNRIRWEKVPQHLVLEPASRLPGEEKAPGEYYRRCAPRIAAFAKACFQQAGIPLRQGAVWIGDSVDVVLHLTNDTFLQWCHVMLSYPQHSYLIPKDVAWCLNYTFEDETFFGVRPTPTRGASVVAGRPR